MSAPVDLQAIFIPNDGEFFRVKLALDIAIDEVGHANLGVTSIYLQGIDHSEVINAIHARPAPVASGV